MFARWKLSRETHLSPEIPASFEVASGVSASFHEDGILLLHVSTGRIFQSNHAGASIWRGIAAGRDAAAIAAEVSSEFGMPQELVASHTASFLAALEQQGFISRRWRS